MDENEFMDLDDLSGLTQILPLDFLSDTSIPELSNLSQVLDPELFDEILTLEIPLSQSPLPPADNVENLPLTPDNFVPSLPITPEDNPDFPEYLISPPSPFKDPEHPSENLEPVHIDPRKRYLKNSSSLEQPQKRIRISEPSTSRDPPQKCIRIGEPSNSRNICEAVPSTSNPDVSDQYGRGRDNFEILQDEVKHIKKYDTRARWVTLKFRERDVTESGVTYIRQMVDDLLVFLRGNGVNDNDRVGLTFMNASRPEQRAIGVSLRRADQLNGEVILQTIESIVQSNEQFFIDGPLQVKWLHVVMDNGGVDNASSFQDFCTKKKSIYVVRNPEDNLCLPRALVVGIAHANKEENRQSFRRYKNILRNDILQATEAVRLCRDAGVAVDKCGGIEALRLFQNHLNEYTVTVVSDRKGSRISFQGPPSTPEQIRKHIDLIFGEGHYNVVLSVTGAFSCSYYCRKCNVPYEHKDQHICKKTCPGCNQTNGFCTESGEKIECSSCNRFFISRDCFLNHRKPQFEKNKSVCDVFKFCLLCKKVYNTLRRKGQHVCYETFCVTCDTYKPSSHLCHIRPEKRKTIPKNFFYVYFDFECKQDIQSPDDPNAFLHSPNYCVTQQSCHTCVGIEDLEQCENCGPRQHTFHGENTLSDFMDYVIRIRSNKNFKKVVLIAHNLKSYDGQFILKHMVEVLKWTPNVIMNGTKIQTISFDNIKFIDSLNFFNDKLSALPKMFELQCNNKGYFPHFFNKSDNWDYEGELPPPSDYGYDTMTPVDRDAFISWYETQKCGNNKFVLQEELHKYCVQDVTILRLACEKFRKLFIEENNIDPFDQCVTIASSCMLTFRKHFLQKDTIGIIPPGGYRLSDNQSRVAIEWLLWEEQRSGHPITHSWNGREKRIGNYRVDGYYENPVTREKIVYEFNGCWFHGCPVCYKDRTKAIPNAPKETMGTRYEYTTRRKEALQAMSYKVVEMWECVFSLQKKESLELRRFLEEHDKSADIPLNPRDAFFGGRTNCTKLFYEADVENGEKIRYYDVCSLYPWACKYGKFPVGHPSILVGDNCPTQLDNVEGIVKCTVLPPETLYHPVLPVRIHNRLMFPLCQTCATDLNQNECTHNNEQRQFTGTWVSDELNKAVSVGYRIIKIHEVWQYQTTQFNGRDGGLFVNYINKFLKLKQEASGWPEWCCTEEDKDRYIKDFEKKEGIKLSKSCIKKNPGFRQLAKMQLNSFWGKFGQRDNLSQTDFLASREELVSLASNPGVEINDLLTVNEDILLANWKYTDDAIIPSKMTSAVIAAYVTAMARLKLYSYLELLGERVLYFDTDSIIFTERTGDVSPPLGDFLGDLTDELVDYGPGSFIDIFVSGGPKNYGYRVSVCGGTCYKTVCKVKGITLNFKNSNQVNFDVLKEMVTAGTPDKVLLRGTRICRNKKMEVLTKEVKKTYRVCYVKRRRVENYDTLPYGYKKPRAM